MGQVMAPRLIKLTLLIGKIVKFLAIWSEASKGMADITLVGCNDPWGSFGCLGAPYIKVVIFIGDNFCECNPFPISTDTSNIKPIFVIEN